MSTYTVVVGNVGTVHETENLRDARFTARCYVDRSKSGRGRCANEPVTVLCDGEIIDEYDPQAIVHAFWHGTEEK